MLLMIESGIRGGACAKQFINMSKQITNIWRIVMEMHHDHIYNI